MFLPFEVAGEHPMLVDLWYTYGQLVTRVSVARLRSYLNFHRTMVTQMVLPWSLDAHAQVAGVQAVCLCAR